MLSLIYEALLVIIQPTNIVLIFLSILFGLVIGMIPGLGGAVVIALLLPLTFGLDPVVAFMMFAAAQGGANFGGSITAIIIGTPGASPNAATLLDGYPMTRKGEGAKAIGASAAASAMGAIFGIIILILFIPLLREILILFGPPEILWLGVWGMAVIAIVVKGSVLTGLISAALGIIIALHGLNSMTNELRWTFGQTFMLDGFKLLPALMGLFAISEMIKLLSEGGSIAKKKDEYKEVTGNKWDGVRAVFENKFLFMRSAVIGAVIGAIPGIGGTAANFIAYFQAQNTEKNSETFGEGDIRGVIASESANDAKDGTAFLPTLGFGIPGSAAMAVLLGGFIMHGMQPGPFFIQESMDIVVIIIITLLISNIITSLIGLSITRQLIFITRLDVRYIVPVILAVVFAGTYAVDNVIYDLWIALAFGIFGFVMMKIDMSRIPLVLALVLTPIIEQNFFRSLQISQGEYTVFVNSIPSLILIMIIVLTLMQPYSKPLFSLVKGRSSNE